MKKVFSVLLVLLIAASLFATGSVKVGGAFGFTNGNFTTEGSLKINYKQHGFGFSVAGSYNLSEKLDVFTDFTMLFTNGFNEKPDADDDYVDLDIYATEVAKFLKLNYSVAAGVKYDLNLDLPVNIKIGGGIFFEKIVYNHEETSYKEESGVTNIGVAALAEAEYDFADSFGAVLTVMPRFGIYNRMKYTNSTNSGNDFDVKGFDYSFSMPISIGVVYNY